MRRDVKTAHRGIAGSVNSKLASSVTRAMAVLSVTGGSRHTGLGGTVRDRGDVRPSRSRGRPPDIRLVQTSDSTAQITSGAYDFDVAIVAFRQEPAWTG
jgi:hypothetical protein